jgi:hypothetical protein
MKNATMVSMEENNCQNRDGANAIDASTPQDIELADDEITSSSGEEEVSIETTGSKTEDELFQREFMSRIFLSRLLVLVVLLASATATSIITYNFTSKRPRNSSSR